MIYLLFSFKKEIIGSAHRSFNKDIYDELKRDNQNSMLVALGNLFPIVYEHKVKLLDFVTRL